MVIHARRNQYLGVNAHASSWLQNREGEWVSFHHDHITDLTRGLNAVLPDGYEARSEHSQDIRDDELSAVVIYRIEEQDQLGRPVTRIELLSPTNKPPGEGYEQYRGKRNAALRSGMPLVEIDYLHQELSVIPLLGQYPTTPESHPYYIIVTDPRPSIKAGRTEIYVFDVDQPIPCFNIPLDREAVPAFDLGRLYNVAFENTPTFHRIIDYERLPLQPETYSATDRQRIVQRMAMIAIVHEAGHNLDETGPYLINADLVIAYLRQHDLDNAQ